MMIWTTTTLFALLLAISSCHLFFERLHVLNPTGAYEANALADSVDLRGPAGSEGEGSTVGLSLAKGRLTVTHSGDGFVTVFRTGYEGTSYQVRTLYPSSSWEDYERNKLPTGLPGVTSAACVPVRHGDIVFAVVPHVRDWPMDRLALSHTIKDLAGTVDGFGKWAGNIGAVLLDDRATVLVAKIGCEQQPSPHSAKLMHSSDFTKKMDPLLYDHQLDRALIIDFHEETGKAEKAAERAQWMDVLATSKPRHHAFLETQPEPWCVLPVAADPAAAKALMARLPVPKVGPPKPVLRSSLTRKSNDSKKQCSPAKEDASPEAPSAAGQDIPRPMSAPAPSNATDCHQDGPALKRPRREE